jgi:hypothetical protein
MIPGKRPILGRHVLRLLIPILIIVGTMAVLTYALTNFRNKAQPQQSPTPEPILVSATPEPTTKPDPYKDWKAYVNRDAELSFKYPPNVSLKEEKLPTGVFVVTLSENATTSAAIAKIISSQKVPSDDLRATYVGGGTQVPLTKEEEIEISGVSGKQGDYTAATGGEGLPLHYAYISRDATNFLFVNLQPLQKDLFTTLLASVRLVTQGITPEWETYTNTSGSYTIHYPPTWQLIGGTATASAKTVTLRKNREESQFQNLIIESQVPTAKQPIELTASEIVSSLQNLSGWKETPTLDFRSLGGGQAQVVSGEKDGAWQVYVVVWYRNTLLQMAWKVTPLRPEQNTFDDIVGSLQFK